MTATDKGFPSAFSLHFLPLARQIRTKMLCFRAVLAMGLSAIALGMDVSRSGLILRENKLVPRPIAFATLPSIGSISNLKSGCCRNVHQQTRTNELIARRGSHLVTYGDIWRTAMDEQLGTANISIENSGFALNHEGVTLTGIVEPTDPRISSLPRGTTLHAVVRPVAKAATGLGAAAAGAAANIWTSLTKGPSEDEVQENLRRWAKARGGAVLPPLEEGELENQVRYMGLFPELVEHLMDADLDLPGGATPAAASAAAVDDVADDGRAPASLELLDVTAADSWAAAETDGDASSAAA